MDRAPCEGENRGRPSSGMSDGLGFWDFHDFDPLRVQVQLSHMDAPELKEHLERQTIDMRRSVESGDKAFLVIDARAGMRPPPEVRKLQADWMAEHEEMMAKSMLGIAFVIDNKLVRGALTAIFWVAKPAVPYRVFASLHEAIAHGIEVCEAAGLAVPERAKTEGAEAVEAALEQYKADARSRAS